MRRTILILFLMTFTVTGYGQTLTGTILGTVSDQSGAVLPGVEVTIINTGTNQTRFVVTNEFGNYSAPNLQVGAYRVEASLPGFSTEVRTGLTLQIDQSARINLELRIGQVTEVVEVTAQAPLIQTDESSVGSVIDSQKIVELPLNGRQFESLVQLVPAAVTPAQGSHLGSRGGFNIAGTDEHYNSFFLDGIDNVDPIVRNFSFRPSIDLIQEFKVEQNSYAAEFGRNAGAVVNVTTKSGTNEFHGAGWEFIRNDVLDARNVFAPTGTQKPALIRNQFGGALGGPIVADRTFFFVSYEGLRAKAGETRRATVPTLKMQNADFSELGTAIIDPQTGQAFPNNIIPADRINPIARAVISAYPVPNIAGAGLTGNVSETANKIQNTDDISFRLDHQLFENTNLMFRYSFSDTEQFDPFRTETGAGVNLKDFGQINDRIRTNAGISFTTVLGNNMVHEFRAGYNRFKQPQLPVNDSLDILQPITGFVDTFLDFRPTGVDNIGSGGNFFRVVNTYNYIDQLSWVTGNHQIKVGVDVRRFLFNAFTAGPNRFDFNGSRGTGNGLADMFLGLPSLSFSFTGAPQGNPRKTEMAAYFQDDWKVSPSFTLNYGLRWEWYGRIEENVDKQSIWDPATNSILVAGQNGNSRSLIEDDWNNFAPRLGFAWRPLGNDSTVIRGGGGIFYDSDQRHNFSFIANPPFFLVNVFVGSQANQTLDDPFPTGTGLPPTLQPNALPQNYRDTYAEQWNFGVQHELNQGLLVDVAYVGNHLLKARRNRNVNQIIPGAGRPFDGFGRIRVAEQAGSSIFHSLQSRVEQRFSNGLSFISSYTYGHAIDDRPGQGSGSNGGTTGMQDNNNPGAERGDADFDVRHRYTLSYVYQLAETNFTGIAGQLLNGWGVNGILMLQGGRPFTIRHTQDISGSGEFNDRPDRIAGVDLVPSNQGPDNWINPAAFTFQPDGTFGNAGRNIARGPTLKNLGRQELRDHRAARDAVPSRVLQRNQPPELRVAEPRVRHGQLRRHFLNSDNRAPDPVRSALHVLVLSKGCSSHKKRGGRRIAPFFMAWQVSNNGWFFDAKAVE